MKTKSKSKKRKTAGDGLLVKGQPGSSEAHQQAFKKNKISNNDTVPQKKKTKSINGPNKSDTKMLTKKEQMKTNTTEILSQREDSSNHASELKTEADSKSLVSKKKNKKKKNNNKYKALNIKQKGERMGDTNLSGSKKNSQQQNVRSEKINDTIQDSTSKEEAKEIKKKKKKKNKSKLLGHTDKNAPQEDITDSQKNNSETYHQNTIQDTTLVSSHGNKIKSNNSLAISVNAEKKKKKKKSLNKPSDIILSNGTGTATHSSLASNGHQNASSEERPTVKNKKVKGEKSVEGNKSEKVTAEAGIKKKKKKGKAKESGNILDVKNDASNSKKAKLEKPKKSEKSSKKVKEMEEEEELVFDSNENCNEKFTKDLDVLLSNLDFSNFKTASSGKETLDDDDDTEVNDTSNHKDSGEWGSEGGQKSKSLRKKRKKMENGKTSQMKIDKKHNSSNGSEGSIAPVKKGSKFNRDRIAKLLEEAATMEREKPSPPAVPDTLKERMEGRLKAARFRMVNQELYTKNSTEARQLFKRDPAAFDIYHQGYQAQVRQWPVNPLDLITKWLSKKPTEWVVADMGCGEAALAQTVPQGRVHSLDLVAANARVTACDMAHTSLASTSVDVVVFCLSLMGTNVKDFMLEANRVLKQGGILKIAEVESRFEDMKEFEKHLTKYGFHCTARDTSHKYFFLLEFKKNRNLKKTATCPDILLKPCLYKKR